MYVSRRSRSCSSRRRCWVSRRSGSRCSSVGSRLGRGFWFARFSATRSTSVGAGLFSGNAEPDGGSGLAMVGSEMTAGAPASLGERRGLVTVDVC